MEEENTLPEKLEGIVQSIRFQNENNGYTVLTLTCEKKKHTAVGTMPAVQIGDKLQLEGVWDTNKNFGMQFKVELYHRIMPTSTDSILAYLSAGTIDTVTKKLAERLVEEFGDETLEMMEKNHEKLTVIKGITEKRALKIHESYCSQMGTQRLIAFLTTHQLPLTLASTLTQYYKNRAIDVIEDNPYILVEEAYGVPFSRVDRLAKAMSWDSDDNKRLQAGIFSVLLLRTNDGHCCMLQDELLYQSSDLLKCDVELLDTPLKALKKSGEIIVEKRKKEKFVYPLRLAQAEEYVANRLLELSQAELRPPDDLDKIIERIQKQQNISYSPEQEEAIHLAAKHQLLLLSGGPGTGKTTVLKGVVALFESLELETVLTAPTGRAAQRLGELCGGEATTIHRLLEASPMDGMGQQDFFRGEENPLSADAVIVDETSMVDLALMDALLNSLPNGCRLILVGDPDQLPSVGPGCVFADLIDSAVLPMVKLSRIFRQAQESMIIKNAHAINQGVLPDTRNLSSDFFFLLRHSSQDTVETIVDLCCRRLPEKMGFSIDQIQVLSPTRQRGTGTASLNKALQEALNPYNPEKGERSFGDWVYRVGDRVMQVKNNYDVVWQAETGDGSGEGVFNGDIGTIVAAHSQGLTVNFEGKLVDYTKELLPQLEPAYAITVHKSQGCEYPAVILAAFDGAPVLMNRKVLYTGLTRAKSLFIVVGAKEVVARMVHDTQYQQRLSGLKPRLEDGA